jgi:lysozyme
VTRGELHRARAKARTREEYRYRKWRHYVATKPTGDPLRRKWHALYVSMRDTRKALDRQLRTLPIHEIDREGIDFIKVEEGFVVGLYHDVRGLCTGGCGHLVRPGRCTTADHAKYDHWTAGEWEALLGRDLDRFEAAVRLVARASKVKVTQHMFNAMVSLAFNIGVAGFLTSSVARELRKGSKRGAANAFMLWVKPPELRGRRQREVALFLRS